jgi:hypothetical protein
MFDFLKDLFKRHERRKRSAASTTSGTGHVSDVPPSATLAPLVLLTDVCEPSRSSAACDPGHHGSHDSGASSGDSGGSSDGGSSSSCD